MSEVRIETAGLMGHQTRVFFVADDGEETEISNVTTGVHVDIRVGEMNRATLELLKVEGLLRAELVDVVVRHVRPRRWGRVRDVTAFGDHWRRKVRA